MTIVRRSVESDFTAMLAIINSAAIAYRGVIPADRWHDPYMSSSELENEIAAGVKFWVAEQNGILSALMGIQDKRNVALRKKNELLRRYWSIPARQIETSVVLGNKRWVEGSAREMRRA